MYQYFQEVQPVHITGSLRHCGSWLTSSSENVVKINQSFKKDKPEIAIYCVHGTADGNHAFSLIADRILHTLPSAVSSIHLTAFSNRFSGQSIEYFSQQLALMIQANHHKTVILMGHSRGGLVCSWFAEFMAASLGIEVIKVISIGTPFGGSELANLPLALLSESVTQMQPNSPWLKDLVIRMQTQKDKYYYFAAERDWIVSLESTLIPEHSNTWKMLSRHDHLSILSSHRLVKHILEIIWGIEKPLSIQTAIEEIDDYLKILEKRGHLRDGGDKIIILQKLQIFLQGLPHPVFIANQRSIGALISDFCKDPTQGQGQKPDDILKASLNYPFSIFQTHESDSYNFVSSLKLKYQNIPVDSPKIHLDATASSDSEEIEADHFPFDFAG